MKKFVLGIVLLSVAAAPAFASGRHKGGRGIEAQL
jgi:hypothetical protein